MKHIIVILSVGKVIIVSIIVKADSILQKKKKRILSSNTRKAFKGNAPCAEEETKHYLEMNLVRTLYS